jgi:hypothetical protein
MKLVWLMTYGLLACAHPVDPRDHTEDESLAYITETIFVPYCATAECHSSFKQASISGGTPIVLDTVENAQATLSGTGGFFAPWLSCTGSDGVTTYDPCDVDGNPNGKLVQNTFLISVLTSNVNGVQMPYDQPLEYKDIQFLSQWIVDGADGYVSTMNGGN